MAPSSTSMLIALLVAFAVVAPMLPTSAAARDGGAAKAAAAPAPSPSASGEEVVHPMDWFEDIFGIHIPDLPLPRILPCPPAFPIKIPFIPCYNVTPAPPPPPPVTECRSSLVKYMPPCVGFLTNSSVPSPPPSKCCDAIRPFFGDSSKSPFCLCHVVSGDAGELFPAPVNHTRTLSFLEECGFNIDPDMVSELCANAPSVPPMDAPSPPPRRGTKA